MTVISKQLYYDTFNGMPDGRFLHPWHDNCWMASAMSVREGFKGSFRFYLIVYLLQIVMRGKKMRKKKEWLKMGEYFIRSHALGYVVAASGCTIACILRHYVGDKYGYYTLFWIPNTINGLAIYLEPEARRGAVVNLFCNLAIEYGIRILEHNGQLTFGKSRQTLLFMIGSAFLFYYLRLEGDKEKKTLLFWLFTPEKVRRKSDGHKNVCPHDGTCSKFIFKGALKLFLVGAALKLSRVILPNIRSPSTAFSKIRWNHFKMGMFFGSYIGIYRAVICYLCRRNGADHSTYALPAGYLAGLSFLFSPSLAMSMTAATAAVRLYCVTLYDRGIIPKNLPLSELLFCITQGILYHARFMDTEKCPNYVFNLMDTVSNGCTKKMYSSMETEIMKKIL